jgi:hypothetical protein
MSTFCVKLDTEFITETCCKCGVDFAMTQTFFDARKNDKESFYCPNGHGQHYTKSEADILRNELKSTNAKLANMQFELIAAEKQVKQLKSRMSKGVCPCCHRQFVSVSRHMKTQHPEFSA